MGCSPWRGQGAARSASSDSSSVMRGKEGVGEKWRRGSG
jgi:hypothetical protein